MIAQQILEKALRLNEEERVVVASSLLESVEAPPSDRRSDEEWLAEIERRARAVLVAGEHACSPANRTGDIEPS